LGNPHSAHGEDRVPRCEITPAGWLGEEGSDAVETEPVLQVQACKLFPKASYGNELIKLSLFLPA